MNMENPSNSRESKSLESPLNEREIHEKMFCDLSNVDKPTVFYHRHSKYDKTTPFEKDYDPEIAGSLTKEGRQMAKKRYLIFFNDLLANTNEKIPLEILLIHSSTKWFDEAGERATETADVVLQAAKEVFDSSDRDVQIISNTGVRIRKGVLPKKVERVDGIDIDQAELTEDQRYLVDLRNKLIDESQEVIKSQGDRIPLAKLRDVYIFPYTGKEQDIKGDQAEYITALEKKFGGRWFEAFVRGEAEVDEHLEEIRKKVGAESVVDIANRNLAVLRGLSMAHNKRVHEQGDEKSKLITLIIGHSEGLGGIMRKAAGAGEEEFEPSYSNGGEDYKYNEGIRIDLNGAEGHVVSGNTGKEYDIKLRNVKT